MASDHRNNLANLDTLFLSGMQYEVLSSDKLQDLGAFEIKYGDVESKTRSPLADYEAKFGPEESGHFCERCAARECHGHLGYIRFPETPSGETVMIYNPMYMGLINKIFGMICMSCCRLAVDMNDSWTKARLAEILLKPRATRLAALQALIGNNSQKYTECVHYTQVKGKYLVCSAKKKTSVTNKTDISVDLQPVHIKRRRADDCTDLTEEDKTSRDRRALAGQQGVVQDIQARIVYDIFQFIGGEIGNNIICEYLGIYKEDMKGYFQDHLPIIPTMYRPKTEGGTNKLTQQYSSIINLCSDFKSGKKDSSVIQFQKTLQKAVTELHIIEGGMLGGKKGILRSTVAGKRPDYNMRAVITPSRTSDTNTIEIPAIGAARGLTKRIDVTSENIEAMQALMFNGKIATVKNLYGRNRGQKIHVGTDNCTDNSNHILQVGDTVWRHALDGDLVMVGRQPTNNKQNIFAVRAKIYNGSTLRPSINTTPGSAADFDGDAMHVSIVQTPEGDEDLKKMLIGKHVRSSQRGAPIYGLTYDAILAATVLTIQRIEVTPELWNTCIVTYRDRIAPDFEARLKKYGVAMYSGRALFSSTLPADFSYVGGEGIKRIVIKRGILVSGMLSSVTVSASTGSIIDQMSIEYHPKWKVTFDFINAATFMLAEFVNSYGFSVTYTDCMFGQNKAVSALLEQRLEAAEKKILSLRRPVTHYERIKYEKDVRGIVNNLKSVAVDSNVFSVDPREEDFVDRMNDFSPEEADIAALTSYLGDISEISTDSVADLCFIHKYMLRLDTLDRNMEKINPYLEMAVRKCLEEARDIIRGTTLTLSEDIASGEEDPAATSARENDFFSTNNLDDRIGLLLVDLRDRLTYMQVYIDPEMSSNGLIMMSKLISGQKGNEGNLTSLGLQLGQQQVMGNRLPQTVTEGSRMLITQRPDSLLPEARGYINSHYIGGMTPNQSFSLSSSVREGMASTNTTSKSIGDTQRQLDRCLEPIKAQSGCSIFHERSILDFSYGGDSMDGLQLLKVGGSYQCCDLAHYANKINALFSD